ncbi:MAG: F0F1 ATP synthase subunit epsilon [Gemmatimonadota bacterium]
MEQGHGGTGAPGQGAMRVSVVSPERVLYEGDASAVVVPAYDGKVGILPRHAPFMALLGEGTLVVRQDGGERRFDVAGGFVQVVKNVVRVVAEKASAA